MNASIVHPPNVAINLPMNMFLLRSEVFTSPLTSPDYFNTVGPALRVPVTVKKEAISTRTLRSLDPGTYDFIVSYDALEGITRLDGIFRVGIIINN